MDELSTFDGDEASIAGVLLVERAEVDRALLEGIGGRVEREPILLVFHGGGLGLAGLTRSARLERIGREGKTVDHPMMVVLAVHLEIDRVVSLLQLHFSNVDPGDEANVEGVVLGDVLGIDGPRHVDRREGVAVEAVQQRGSDGVGTDPEVKIACRLGLEEVRRLAGLVRGSSC